ncbi:MAG: extracellular solute-binding protein [Chloroflexota bacterium]|nr:extracellular solute-binding protein [Chloroflexota bacterium]
MNDKHIWGRRRPVRFITTLISVLALASMLFSACTPTAAPTAAPTEVSATEPAATEEPQPLPPITILINDSPWFAGFEALVNKYVEETGHQVNLNVTPFTGMLEKSRNAVQAPESEFDILNLNEQWYMQFYADELVTPIKEIDPDFELDPQIIEYEWSTRWNPELGYSTQDGEFYGLPINGNIMLFFYRKDLFEEQGLPVPQTWEDVEMAAQALHNPPDTYGYVIRTNPPNWEFQGFLAGYGGRIITLDEESGEWEVTIHQEPGQKAIQTWLKLGIDYGPPNYADIGQPDMAGLMSSGKAVQFVLVGAAAPDFDNPEKSLIVGNVGATVLPGGTPETRATMSGIWVMGIPHNLPIERKQAALAFLNWALSKEAQLFYAQSGAIPVRQDVYEELADDPKLGWWMKAMADSTPYIYAQPRLAETPQIVEVVNRRLQQAVIEEISAEDALWEAAQEIHKILEDGGYKVKPLVQE